MFSRETSQNTYGQGTYNYRSNTSSYNNNGLMNRDNSQQGIGRTDNNQLRLGSYRIQRYNPDKLSECINNATQWKNHIPISICLREETTHLTPTELRAEDYYLIRTKKIDERIQK